MNDNLHDLEDEAVLNKLFNFYDVLNFLDLDKSDIIAFYIQESEGKNMLKYVKEYYLTNNSIIVVEFIGGNSNKTNIELFPIKNYTIDTVKYSILTKVESFSNTINLELEDIHISDTIDCLIQKPIKRDKQACFHNDFINFKKKLINIMLK